MGSDSGVYFEAVKKGSEGDFLSGKSPSELVDQAEIASTPGSWSLVARRIRNGAPDMSAQPSLFAPGTECEQGRGAVFTRGDSRTPETMPRLDAVAYFNTLMSKADVAGGLARKRGEQGQAQAPRHSPR